MDPSYDLDKIKFGLDSKIWEKAVNLYETRKVTNFKDNDYTFTANVSGTHLYNVVLSPKKFTDGDCTCYLGQNDILCKHMIAVAIYALKKGKPLSEDEITQHNEIKFSGKRGELSLNELSLLKAEISAALRYIKAYEGPSRIWFAYQDSLSEGCNRLAAIFSNLAASPQTSRLIIKILLRLDFKLTHGGVDDSDGTVGGFIEEAVQLLLRFTEVDPMCVAEFKILEGKETCFGWEETLLKLL